MYPTLKYMEHETDTEASSMVSLAQGICHFKNSDMTQGTSQFKDNDITQGTSQFKDWNFKQGNDVNTAVLIQTWDNDNQSLEWTKSGDNLCEEYKNLET